MKESERIRGAWLGLAVGDALGAPVEFMSAEVIAARFGRWDTMRAGGPWLCGETTDDYALADCVRLAYVGGGFDLNATADAMVAWLAGGPKDVGNLTRDALGRIGRGRSTAVTAGRDALRDNPGSAGNGSLMRAAATGLIRRATDPRLAAESRVLSAITHADRRCIDACIAYNVILTRLIDAAPVADALAEASALDLHADVRAVLAGRTYNNADGIGFVLLGLAWSLEALQSAPSFEQGLVDLIARGGDTDTNAAIAGALLGARFGEHNVPAQWTQALRDHQAISAAADSLVRLRGSL